MWAMTTRASNTLSVSLLLPESCIPWLSADSTMCPVLRRFLCAMQPTMRQNWAAAWARHIRAGGQLVTLMFPVDPKRPRDEGPPFPLTPELYTELLTSHGTSAVLVVTCMLASPCKHCVLTTTAETCRQALQLLA